MTKNKISVVLAVYNEEGVLKDCLSSAKDLASEIIIVDGGSIDDTLSIASEFNAKIIKSNNPQNFHINKNKAIDAANSDWILQLDADEMLTKELIFEIRKVIQNNDIDGYWIPRKNFFLGRFLTKGGQYPDYTLRLYRNGKGRLPGNDVHEQAVVNGRVSFLKNPMLHMRDKNFSIYTERFKRYTDLLATQLKEKGEKANLVNFVKFILIMPLYWFLKAYIRHRGYVDGLQGLIFAFFSALRYPVSYLKLLIRYKDLPNSQGVPLKK